MARRDPQKLPGKRRRSRARAALAALAMLACAGPVAAQQGPPAAAKSKAPAAAAVTVRVWPHKGYGRIVFDWPRPPVHSISRDGDGLAIGFDTPFTATLDPITGRLDAYVTAARLGDDSRSVGLDLRPGVRIKSFKIGNSLVVDLLPPAKPESAAGTPVVPVRVGTHVNFNRLVFDWPRDVSYTVGEKDGRTIIAFDRAGAIDTARLQSTLPPFVRGIGVDGDKAATVTLDLVPGAGVRHFRAGMSVVVDVLAPRPGAKTAKAKAKVADTPAKVPSEKAPASTADAVRSAAPPARAEAEPIQATGPVALFDMSGKPVNGVAQRAITPKPSPARAQTETSNGAPTSLTAADAAARVPDSIPVILTIGDAQAKMTFHWPEEVGIAVFERAGYLWAVFDRDGRFAFDGWDKAMEKPSPNSKRRREDIPARAFIDIPQSSSMPGTSVFRMKIPAGVNPHVLREGSAWSVILEREYLKPASGVNVEAHMAAAGARLFIAYPGAGQAVAVSDPEVGDRIWVVPLAQPERGIGLARTYAEVELFATAQGLAGRAISDAIVFRTLPRGIEIAAGEGLTLSGITAAAARTGRPDGTADGLRPGQTRPGWLFDFESWRRTATGGFVENKHALLRAAAMAPPTTRNTIRLELAQLFFAYNHLTDVLGLLQVIEQDEPELAQEPVFRALRGAAHYRLGELERAGRDLNHASLDGFKEIALWRAALAAAAKDWVSASRFFARAETVTHVYPIDLQVHFGLQAAEASLNIGDVGLAKFHLDRLVTLASDATARAHINYLRGHLLAKVLDPEGAVAAWQRAIEGPDRRMRVLATMARTGLLLEKEKITKTEAAQTLEKLRFSWRGDELEFKVLNQLGRAYIDAGDYKNGLMTLKELATHFSGYPGIDEVIDRMRAAFIKLYVDGAADRIPPLTALALYDQFRELTPPGPVGDTLVSRLAERLVAVDLLDRAATLLRHLVDERLGGTARIEAANRLALVYLLDRKPQEALDTLAGKVPPDLIPTAAMARRHLKARALIEMARYKEVLALVTGDTTLEADRLRAEVFWKLRDWANAAIAYHGIIKATVPELDTAKPEAGQASARARPIAADAQQDVLSLAIAYALGRNQAALRDLRMRFLGRMAETGFKESFDVITAPSGIVPDDFSAITGKIAEVDQFRAFMKSYREKLLGRGRTDPSSAPPPTGAPAPQAQTGTPGTARG